MGKKPQMDLLQYHKPLCSGFQGQAAAKLIFQPLLFRAQLAPYYWHNIRAGDLVTEWALDKNAVTRGLLALEQTGLIIRSGQKYRVDPLQLSILAKSAKQGFLENPRNAEFTPKKPAKQEISEIHETRNENPRNAESQRKKE
ncbi:hypothetical protein [Ruegeria lacuscaerulensis]|uniref:hypothetical protein n=1 Tax=Ruegeria lacuscaerulensis TaxID=55218 RepID=UPI00147C7720|nr:hypothetical protein [Ruegeria lacuscaerulensis]